jgi:hypothetical protein
MLTLALSLALFAADPAPAPAAPAGRPRWMDTSLGQLPPADARCVNIHSVKADEKGLIWFDQTACGTRIEISNDGVDCATMKAYWRDRGGALQENLYKPGSPFAVMLTWVCAHKS